MRVTNLIKQPWVKIGKLTDKTCLNSSYLGMTHIYGCEVSGVDMKLDCEVQGAEKIGDIWVIQTNQGIIKVKILGVRKTGE